LDRPIAFETGVNYLKSAPGELSDGEFFAEVAVRADCGILLDLHNLWVNERNARDRVDDVLTAIPLHRVWEIHVAGGSQLRGHQLDAHSGAVPDAVWELVAKWLPRMPNVGALIFEILDEHVNSLGDAGIARQLKTMRELWGLRSKTDISIGRATHGAQAMKSTNDTPSSAWEDTLGALVLGRDISSDLAVDLRTDLGVELFRDLVFDSRAGFISQGLRYTTTLLLCALGAHTFRELLCAFFASRPPELFASAEADAFATFLLRQPLSVPFLRDVLGYEHALLKASLYGLDATIRFDSDPNEIFESLEQGRLPARLQKMDERPERRLTRP
jgi:hypothetical protein